MAKEERVAIHPPLPLSARQIGKIRGRGILIAFLLLVSFTVISGWAALVRHEILGTGYLPRGVVPLFVLLVTVNALIKHRFPSLALTRPELLFIFALLMSIASISGQEFAIHFYLNLLGLVYYSAPESQWFGLFLPHLPPWLVPSLHYRDPVILWAYEGMPEGAKVPFSDWLIPLLAWTPYLFGVYAFLVFIGSLFAPQWEERERLLYPLTQIPSELAGTEERPFPQPLRSPLFWLGFSIPASLYSLRGFHIYFPTVPDPQPQRSTGILFGTGPLSVFDNMPLHLYPEMVGIASLLSREVGLSLWFFVLLRRLEVAARIAFGVNIGHGEFLSFQSVAAYLVMAASIFWMSRTYLKGLAQVLRHRLARKFFPATHPEGEQKSPPEVWPLLGSLLTFLGLLAWAKFLAKASVLWSAVLLLSLVVTSLVVARVVSEAGIFIYSAPFRSYQVIFDAFGVNRIGAKNVVLLTAMSWVQIRSTATMALGYLSNAFRILSAIGLAHSSGALWMLAGIFVALLTCHLTVLTVIYHYSVSKLSWWAQRSSLNTANFIGRYLTGGRPLTVHHRWGLAVGAFTCWLLIKLRLTLLNFPFHPIGFVTWLGWPIDRYWLSILIGWMIKAVILRFGGYRAWMQFRPFAYGLTVGGCATLTFWILLHLFYPTGEPILID